MPTHLHTIYGCFHPELSSCDRNYMTCNTCDNCFLALFRKSLLTSEVNPTHSFIKQESLHLTPPILYSIFSPKSFSPTDILYILLTFIDTQSLPLEGQHDESRDFCLFCSWLCPQCLRQCLQVNEHPKLGRLPMAFTCYLLLPMVTSYLTFQR